MNHQQITPNQAQRFKQLAWPMLPVVLRTAQYLAGQGSQAEDLAQETMIKAMRAMDSYQDDTNIKAWLLTILRRTHIDQLRASHNRPLQLSLDVKGIDLPASPESFESVTRSDEVVIDAWHEPEKMLERFDDHTIIAAMRSLSEDLRWTLLLVDVEQMNHADAATILNVAVGTVKSRTHRGRALLREQLHDLAVQRGWVSAKEKTS